MSRDVRCLYWIAHQGAHSSRESNTSAKCRPFGIAIARTIEGSSDWPISLTDSSANDVANSDANTRTICRAIVLSDGCTDGAAMQRSG